MSLLTALYGTLFYAATLVLVVGLFLKIRRYYRTPAPLKIPKTPAPTSRSGVALRLTREVVFFESLFKSSKWTWFFGWTFHVSLALVLCGTCAISRNRSGSRLCGFNRLVSMPALGLCWA